MLALILRADYHAEGIQVFTHGDFSQPLGYMNRPASLYHPAVKDEALGVRRNLTHADLSGHLLFQSPFR